VSSTERGAYGVWGRGGLRSDIQVLVRQDTRAMVPGWSVNQGAHHRPRRYGDRRMIGMIGYRQGSRSTRIERLSTTQLGRYDVARRNVMK
jgi:hypothetical protein